MVNSYGSWLFETVFANDAAQALDEKTKNPVWLRLVRRAGGPRYRRLREAAQHVARFNLTQAKTREYVAALAAVEGEKREVRLTTPVLMNRLRKLSASLGGAARLRNVRTLRSTMEDAEIENVRTVLHNIRGT